MKMKPLDNLLTACIEAARFVGDNASRMLLERWKAQLENPGFILPVAGQFSAGKSKFINRLLGKDLLPVKSSETTFLPTYIRYGESFSAFLETQDKREIPVTAEEVKRLDQQGAGEQAAQATGLFIQQPAACLKEGLVLVDTPGINTLLNNHVSFTEELLDASFCLLYVLAKPPTEQDIQIIKRLESSGIYLFFIRTKIDQVNEHEECPEETFKQEQNFLKTVLEREIDYFPLSNLPDPQYDHSFVQFTEFLENNLIPRLEEIYTGSMQRRIRIQAGRILQQLENGEAMLRKAAQKPIEELRNQQQKLSDVLKKLSAELENKRSRFRKSGDLMLDSLIRQLRNVLGEQVDNLTDQLTRLPAEGIEEKALRLCRSQLSETVDILARISSGKLREWAKELTENIQEDLISLRDQLEPEGFNFACDFDLAEVDSYHEKLVSLEMDFKEKYQHLLELKTLTDQELSELGVSRLELENTLKAFEDEVHQVHGAMAELERSYTPDYRKKNSKSMDAFKRIGTVCDVAMLLIPASFYTKAASAMAVKSASLAQAGGTLNRVGSTVMGTLSKTSKVLAATDRIKDVTFLLDRSIDQLKEANQLPGAIKKGESTNIFSYLSMSFVFEKVGEMVTPPTYEADPQAEYDYLLRKTGLTEKKEQLAEGMSEGSEKIKEIQRKEREKWHQSGILEKQKREEEECYKQEKRKLEEERDQKKVTVVAEQAALEFRAQLVNFIALLEERITQMIEKLGENVIQSAGLYAGTQLENYRNQLNALTEEVTEKESHLAAKLAEYEQYKKSLQEIWNP